MIFKVISFCKVDILTRRLPGTNDVTRSHLSLSMSKVQLNLDVGMTHYGGFHILYYTIQVFCLPFIS
jgi:hypothetical protein